jgi:hypothetical protein
MNGVGKEKITKFGFEKYFCWATYRVPVDPK